MEMASKMVSGGINDGGIGVSGGSDVNSGDSGDNTLGFAVHDLHMPPGKRPYELTGFYERTNPHTGMRERLGPGEIVMLTPNKAKSLGAIPVKGSRGSRGEVEE